MTPTLCCCEVVHVCVIFVLTVRVRMTKDRYLTGTKTRQAKYCFCSESGHSTKQVLEKIIGQVPAAAHQWMERKNGQLKKKKKSKRERLQYVRRLTISQLSSPACEFKQLSCLSDPLWGINGLVERCFRRCLPAPQEPERAIRVRGRGSEGMKVWAWNYRLTEAGTGNGRDGKGVQRAAESMRDEIKKNKKRM